MQIMDVLMAGAASGAGGILLGVVKVGRIILKVVRWLFVLLVVGLVYRVLLN